MYVCVCNAVTERDIGHAVSRGCESLRDLREELGVGACCGRCSECARHVLHRSLEATGAPRRAPSLQLAAA